MSNIKNATLQSDNVENLFEELSDAEILEVAGGAAYEDFQAELNTSSSVKVLSPEEGE